MMMFDTRAALRLTARVALAGAMTIAAARSASADDAGIHGFFSAIFGGDAAEARPVPAPMAAVVEPVEGRRSVRSRPLTIRLQNAAPRYAVTSDIPVKPIKVSIFEDRTLRRGDAVMTAHGIRIFAGSNSWPYAPQDFVDLSEAGLMNRTTSKVLAELDRAPRG